MIRLNTSAENQSATLSNSVTIDGDLVLLQRKEDVDQFVADAWATAVQQETKQAGSDISNYGGAVSQVLTATQSSAVIALLLHFGLPEVASAIQNPLFSEAANVLSTTVSVALTGVFAAGFVINAFRNRAIRQSIEHAQGEVQENVTAAKGAFARISDSMKESAEYVYNNFIKVAK